MAAWRYIRPGREPSHRSLAGQPEFPSRRATCERPLHPGHRQARRSPSSSPATAVYAPATAGVTGGQGPLHRGLPTFVDSLRALTHPVAVGIGVSTPAQAALVGSYADAVIVGSAFIRAIEATRGPAGAHQAAVLAQRLADGLRRAVPTAARTDPSRVGSATGDLSVSLALSRVDLSMP
ncbi:tryptophan synthase subunit alpha [Streptomyces sp. NBC_01571]|uniref:tryptophan synthase subunit alpha n=1 Tax=Streptomyces sp. NBC_01571 TaxID=2975883 RepID=UPI00225A9304|nr:tryptophan synthase subunit alpha [Streptomyces sp. NBC_01571]MCX4573464.1 tryptophan synthase subunit alpha [Streptomyces sp. NBC_01571]